MDTAAIDPALYRRVLGHYATGIAVVTALGEGEEPVGMAVTSFTSVSLDPMLVAFCPDKGSSTWPKIEQAGRFCVNLLSHDQEAVCRAFATRGGDKFAGVDYRISEHGLPVLEGVLASIECQIHSVVEAGDHWIVLGRVLTLEADAERDPLLFFRSAYAQLAPLAG
ncbi:flavin reductase family protein [Novosphingobium malaysiense]|uniref:Monooxygenase n=1 Tax=Novosphingobium malaysiense TaxID=1348853 RepID=A0A0B1ZUW7_9SPHN|nr:flavin reductase family protein [Novosphingobium malaysiense]KHK92922.1 monooxygenase [Novosphingobium malaysiense]